MDTKRCYKCKQDKPLDAFHKQHNGTKGCAPQCKECKRVYQKAHYQNNKVAYHTSAKIARKKWGEGNGKARVLEHAIATRQRRRAQQKGGDHILMSDLYKRDKGICGICDEPCTREDASLDHIIPLSSNGPHIWCNVQLAHLQCNRIKGSRHAA